MNFKKNGWWATWHLCVEQNWGKLSITDRLFHMLTYFWWSLMKFFALIFLFLFTCWIFSDFSKLLLSLQQLCFYGKIQKKQHNFHSLLTCWMPRKDTIYLKLIINLLNYQIEWYQDSQCKLVCFTCDGRCGWMCHRCALSHL